MRNKPIIAFLYPSPEREHLIDSSAQDVLDRAEDRAEACRDDEIAFDFDFDLQSEDLRRFPLAIGSSFLWITHKGEVYNVDDMATPHIFYSLRMLFNHTVPPVFRVLGPGETMKRYPDVPRWNRAYVTEAIAEFKNELDRRGDLESPLKEQYEDMKANAGVILALGI